jgi:osmoprotectant transport system permease protein
MGVRDFKFIDVWVYIAGNQDYLKNLVLQHAHLVLFAILFGIIIGVTLGLLASYYKPVAAVVLPFAQIMMTVPSIALIGILLPITGIGFKNALVALVLYSLLPIIRNTYTGIKEINPSILEAASGMGLSEGRILWRIKLPLVMPVVFAGIRTAIVMIVGIGAIAAYVGAGGLGDLIFRGISRGRPVMILTGALFISIIAISLDIVMGWIERKLMARQT